MYYVLYKIYVYILHICAHIFHWIIHKINKNSTCKTSIYSTVCVQCGVVVRVVVTVMVVVRVVRCCAGISGIHSEVDVRSTACELVRVPYATLWWTFIYRTSCVYAGEGMFFWKSFESCYIWFEYAFVVVEGCVLYAMIMMTHVPYRVCACKQWNEYVKLEK